MNHNNNITEMNPWILPDTYNYQYKMDMIENYFLPHNDSDFKFYPHNFEELIIRIKDYYKLNKDILLTSDTDGALELICRTYLSSESKVLIPYPTYTKFYNFAREHTKEISYLELTNETISSIDIKLFSGYDLVYFTVPNLPLGYVFTYELFYKLITENPNTLFIIDESYFEFGPQFRYCDIDASNVIFVRTFSKAYSMAALQLGYLFTKDLTLLQKLYNPFISQISIDEALKRMDNIQYYELQINNIKLIRDFAQNYLSTNNVQAITGHGMFLLLLFPVETNMYRKLLDKSIITSVVTDVYPNNECILISVLPFDDMKYVLQTIITLL